MNGNTSLFAMKNKQFFVNTPYFKVDIDINNNINSTITVGLVVNSLTGQVNLTKLFLDLQNGANNNKKNLITGTSEMNAAMIEYENMVANWIKQNITDMDLVENKDYFTKRLQSQIGKTKGFKEILQYNIKVSTAKEIAMVAGAKGGRTSKELKENSKLARRYFIAIESAFKNRKDWNYDRAGSLVGYKGLQQAFMKYRPQLLKGLPEWSRNNIQIAEFWAINDVIIGMKSNEFRNVMGLNKSESIRNAFTEQQLEYVTELEMFDADLIAIHNIFDFEERHNKLYEKYLLLAKGKFA